MSTNQDILLEEDLDGIDYSIDSYLANSKSPNIIKARAEYNYGDVIGTRNGYNIIYTDLFEDPDKYFDESIRFISRVILDALMYYLGLPNMKKVVNDKVQDMLMPHVVLHIARNSRMGKMYIEYDLDYYLKHILLDANLYGDFYNYVSSQIYNNYQFEIVRYWPANCAPKQPGVECKQSNGLNINTVSYWRSINGHYQFLEDRVECDMDRTAYRLNRPWSEYTRKMELYVAKVHNINNNLLNGNFTIPEAFERYRTLYEEEFGYRLKACNWEGEGEEDNRYVFIEIHNLLEQYEPAEEE